MTDFVIEEYGRDFLNDTHPGDPCNYLITTFEAQGLGFSRQADKAADDGNVFLISIGKLRIIASTIYDLLGNAIGNRSIYFPFLFKYPPTIVLSSTRSVCVLKEVTTNSFSLRLGPPIESDDSDSSNKYISSASGLFSPMKLVPEGISEMGYYIAIGEVA